MKREEEANERGAAMREFVAGKIQNKECDARRENMRIQMEEYLRQENESTGIRRLQENRVYRVNKNIYRQHYSVG